MNAEHVRAFLWLRWRLRVNQFKRAGTLNAVILAVFAGAAVLLALLLFVVLFLIGLFGLRQTSAVALLLIWDGLVAAFLFCWTIGLLSELQRSEVLAFEKFLHLPVSLTGAFLINYLSSFFSLTLLIFVPALVGFSLGLVFARGPLMLLLFPLLAAFLLMVTALTYQFQGWLASLMVNKRRRRTIIVLATLIFVLVCQLPNLFNLMRPWKRLENPPPTQRSKEQVEEAKRQAWRQVEETARLANLVLPPGWLPLGAAALEEGEVLPALLGSLGLTLIGAASLWRAYRTTLRLYTGQFGSTTKRAVVPAPPAKSGTPATTLLEWELPGLSEQASAIALAGFRSLVRAPEAKLMLLAPILLVVVFGGLFLRRQLPVPDNVRPLVVFGTMATILLSLIQFAGNQFGFDRNGFRVFVLCAARRRDILLGKNLALAPLALGLGLVMVVLLQLLAPMRVDYFLSAFPQLVAMYLLYCLLANCLSILSPMLLTAGSLKPVHMRGMTLLLHLAFVFLFPLALLPTLLPLGIQVLLEQLGWVEGVPICLLLSLLECVAVVYLYHLVLTWQGDWLQSREQRILDLVSSKAE